MLKGSFRQTDILTRIGGDEFVALRAGSTDESAVRARLDESLRRVNAKPDRAYALGVSVGVLTCQPTDGGHVEHLLERADSLMYREKRGKRQPTA